MKILSIVAVAALSMTCAVGAAQASVISINFDAVTTGAQVDGFYNGGTDSASVAGPNLGVGFVGFLTTTGFGETSQPNLAYNFDSTGTGIIDVAAGFSGSVAFTYGAFADGLVSIYSGLDGTGSLLASATLPAGYTSAFAPFSLATNGSAESIVITGGQAQIGIDDLTIGTSAAPEPAAWALMMAGVGGMGAALRTRRRKVAA